MKKRRFLLLPIICTITFAFGQPKQESAQLKTYLSFEAGPQWSLMKVDDPGNQFRGARVRSSIAGLTLGQEIRPNLSIVTGAYFSTYRNGINMIDDRPHQSMWTSYNAYMIPLRAEYRIQPTEYPFSFTPRLGYVFGLVQSGDSYSASGILSAPDGTAYSYDLSESFSTDNLHMLELGIGLNLRLYGFWQASLNISYLSGFTDPLSTPLDYTDDGGTSTSATYSSRGSSFYTTLAFNIPVSNIWQNKDYRIRKRIEGSVSQGNPVEKKGQFYVGGEVGSLWRLFNASNPAIGARPMEDRGLFRYANLHTGAYVGYMFSNELGIDAGVIYQGSSTFYAIMYDHQVNFLTETTAPMYLEFPLRVRYFYDVYKGRIHLAVNGGASLLTQFSSGIHAQGGGDFSYLDPESGSPLDASTTFEASRIANIRPLLRLGAGVEYGLPMQFPLIATFYINYMQGFLSTEQLNITNTVPETPVTSVINYGGSGWSLDIGLKIPLRFGEGAICQPLPSRE